ncbi:MAG: bifunctional oligoribonuclease/PAP phosphatase NrnA [Clostridium sp.]
MTSVKTIIDLIKLNNNFAIVSHTSPDGDCMGSMLGLYNCLKLLNKNVNVYLDDVVPKRLSFLEGASNIITEAPSGKYDIVFALDCGDTKRLSFSDILLKETTVINIDHHKSNDYYGTHNYVCPEISSVGEMLFSIMKEGELPIDRNVAICLYTSIVSDTGGFKYSNTSPSTLISAANLMEFNIDHSKIYNRLLDEKTKQQLKLTALATNELKFYFDDKLAIIYLSDEIIKESGVDENETGDIVNIGRDIDTVEVSALIKKKSDNLYKISLRSKNYADVRFVAESFSGGGHIRAAGCAISGDIDFVIDSLLSKIKEII